MPIRRIMIMVKSWDKPYRRAVILAFIGYLLLFVSPIFHLPDIIFILIGMACFGMLGYAYKTILMRNSLPDFIVLFGAVSLVLFCILMIAQMFELLGWFSSLRIVGFLSPL